ncbi:molybdenum cofactor guanylyltransferase MobA [Mesorhizobium sp. CC13]|uniref:molybdenum cofactor guanylyltransferase MobA n=1 Tax=Mesorhizobium sp. CC13 TaxID=3029194 RepID=UPI0032636FC0
MRIAGLILAGGRSTRMGGTDKTLLVLGGRPMIARVLDRLQRQASPMAINTNGDPSAFAHFGVDVIADTIAGHQGPLAGILAGMEWAANRSTGTHLLSVAGDTPFFPGDLAARLAHGGSADRIAAAASNGRVHPTFALWPVSLRRTLAEFLESGNTRRVMTFMEQAGMDVVEFQSEEPGIAPLDPFFNINTPEDLAEAERLLAGAR